MEVSSPKSKAFLFALAAAAGSAAAIAFRSASAERRYRPQGQYCTVNGVRLHYVGSGTGTPVVLIHGNGAMTEDLRLSGLIEGLAGRYRTVAYDRPGFGYSERPPGANWSPEAQADLLAKANELLDIQRPVVVAQSWGTLVALALAMAHPNHLAGLVLISGFYWPQPQAGTMLFAPAATPLLGDLLNHTVSPWIGQAMTGKLIQTMFSPDPVPPQFEREFPVPLALRPGQIKAFAQESVAMTSAAARLCQRYGEVSVPVTIFAGNQDKIVDVEQARRLHASIPGSSLRIIANGSHMLHHSQTSAIVDAVDAMSAEPAALTDAG